MTFHLRLSQLWKEVQNTDDGIFFIFFKIHFVCSVDFALPNNYYSLPFCISILSTKRKKKNAQVKQYHSLKLLIIITTDVSVTQIIFSDT